MGLSGANLPGVVAIFTLNWFGAGIENGHTGTPVRQCKRVWGCLLTAHSQIIIISF